VEICASRNLTPRVTLVTEARASRLALGNVRVRVQRMGSLPRLAHRTVAGAHIQSVTVPEEGHEGVIVPRVRVSTAAEPAVRGRAGTGSAVTGQANSTGAVILTTAGADTVQGTAASSAAYSPSPSFPSPSLALSSPLPFPPSAFCLLFLSSPSSQRCPVPSQPHSSQDLRYRTSLSLLACVGRVEANSLSLLLSSHWPSTPPTTFWGVQPRRAAVRRW